MIPMSVLPLYRRFVPSLLLMGTFATHGYAANEVTLVSNTSDLELVGEIVSFDNVTYLINSTLGEMYVRADEFTCIGDNCPLSTAVPRNSAQANTVVISGSDTIAEELMGLLLAGYAGHLSAAEIIDKPDGAIEAVSMFVGNDGFGEDLGSYLVRSSVSSDAFANLLGLSADIGMSSRRISQDEIDALATYGAGDMTDPQNEHIIAIDSLIILTHPSNTVDTITLEQLRDIYSGRITNWSELGGPNAPINAVQLSEGSGTRSVFENRVFQNSVPGVPASLVPASGNAEASAIVSEDPYAIGYASAAFQRDAEAMTVISDCGIPMVPNAFSARTEEYNLGRFLYLYTRGDNINPDVRSLVTFATSSGADTSVAKSGFIDLGVSRQSQVNSPRTQLLENFVGRRSEQRVNRDMLSYVDQYDRLSATFRFDFGSQQLTDRSVLNLDRLINYLVDQPAGSDVIVAGFTDSVGSFSNNLGLGERRAQQVLEELQRAAGGRLDHLNLTPESFGEAAPAACNSSDYGRSINRRVEIWINNAPI